MRVEVPPSRPKRPTKAPKKRVKQPRPLVTAQEPSVTTYRVRLAELRSMAAQDYITDAEQRSVDYWHNRPDRLYREAVSIHTFREWSVNDGWVPRRAVFWEEVEDRVFEAYKNQLVKKRMEEIALRTEERDAMVQYIRPLRDSVTGEILRHPKGHPLEGLPKMPLELGKFHEVINAFVKFDEHLMTLRGETTKRTEVLTAGRDGSRTATLDPVEASVTISDDDIHEMSRALLRRRQPELMLKAEFEDPEDVTPDEAEGQDD